MCGAAEPGPCPGIVGSRQGFEKEGATPISVRKVPEGWEGMEEKPTGRQEANQVEAAELSSDRGLTLGSTKGPPLLSSQVF